MPKLRALLPIAFLFIAPFYYSAGTIERHLLERCISYEGLEIAIRYGQSWVDYPGCVDRKAWEKRVAPEMKEIITRNGEKTLAHIWKPDLASDYLTFRRAEEIRVGRTNHQALQALTFAELVEGKGRFTDIIIDGTWFLRETSWMHSAYLGFREGRSGLPGRDELTIELVVTNIGAQIAWTYYLLKNEFDKVDPLVNQHIVEKVIRSLIAPYSARDDYWWMGFDGRQVNNWNPWINYNVLRVPMLVETDMERICRGVQKLIKSTDFFFSTYHEDGTCDEGPTYWSGAFGYALKFLDLLVKVTRDKVNISGSPLLRNMAQYTYRVYINGSYFINFADSASKANLSPDILYQYGKLIGDPAMMEFASLMAQQNQSFENEVDGYFASALDELFMYKDVIGRQQSEPLTGVYWFKDTQTCMVCNAEGTGDGFFFTAKGRHNRESHNHNNVGLYILYYDARSILINASVGAYTWQTFSPERYTIRTIQPGYHNLPLINGTAQKNGKEFAAHDQQYRTTAQTISYQMDIAGAYSQGASVESWIRGYTLHRKRGFTITSKWELSACLKSNVLSLMACCGIETDSHRNIILMDEAGKFRLEYNKKVLSPEIKTIKLTDSKLIYLRNKKKFTCICFTILSQQATDESKLIVKRL